MSRFSPNPINNAAATQFSPSGTVPLGAMTGVEAGAWPGWSRVKLQADLLSNGETSGAAVSHARTNSGVKQVFLEGRGVTA